MHAGSHQARSLWMEDDPGIVRVIDQRKLPFRYEVLDLASGEDACEAIAGMAVRGAPLIGVTAAYGLYLSALKSGPERWCEEVTSMGKQLLDARPTAVNLRYAVGLALAEVDCAGTREGMIERLFHFAAWMAEQEARRCRKIGEFGLPLIRALYEKKGEPVQILTHCNAGWLACIAYGTATAPIYLAHEEGIPLHVWVDETRPRNQGARLTAWELARQGVPHTVVVDNAGGQLMQQGEVDLVLVGSDRTTRNGDVANKIGTYLKALAAFDNHIPFYVALPSSSIDLSMKDGREIPIEYRDEEEVSFLEGWDEDLKRENWIRIVPPYSHIINPGFDITPARLVTGLITERGICPATKEGISAMFGS